jgi:hypothetical protein
MTVNVANAIANEKLAGRHSLGEIEKAQHGASWFTAAVFQHTPQRPDPTARAGAGHNHLLPEKPKLATPEHIERLLSCGYIVTGHLCRRKRIRTNGRDHNINAFSRNA